MGGHHPQVHGAVQRSAALARALREAPCRPGARTRPDTIPGRRAACLACARHCRASAWPAAVCGRAGHWPTGPRRSCRCYGPDGAAVPGPLQLMPPGPTAVPRSPRPAPRSPRPGPRTMRNPARGGRPVTTGHHHHRPPAVKPPRQANPGKDLTAVSSRTSHHRTRQIGGRS